MQSLSSALLSGVLLVSLCLSFAAPTSWAGEGSLGIFENTQASSCKLNVSPGDTRTFHVVFAPDGSTRGGVIGMEFQVDTQSASGYLVLNEVTSEHGLVTVGNATSGGLNVAFGECLNNVTIPLVRFDVINLGNGTSDAPLFVGAHSNPSNDLFECALANLCDAPAFTAVCIAGGVGVLNASSDVACGSGAQRKKWSRVKALYR